MPPMPQAHFVEGDMTNAELRAALMNLTQLMTAKAHTKVNCTVNLSLNRHVD